MIGHSKGGGVVIETLRALAGAYGDEIAVVDPRTGVAEPRTRYLDPATGESRRVVDLVASATPRRSRPGACRASCAGSSSSRACCATCPDSVERFIGFTIPYDPIAGTFAGDEDPYRATGRADGAQRRAARRRRATSTCRSRAPRAPTPRRARGSNATGPARASRGPTRPTRPTSFTPRSSGTTSSGRGAPNPCAPPRRSRGD